MSGEETYPMPEHGWTCFHCGDKFTTVGAARIHFGADPSAVPGCLIKVQPGREKGLLMVLRKAEDEIERLRSWDAQREQDASNYHATVGDLERYFGKGVRSAYQAFQVLDSMEGRAIAADEKLDWIEAHQAWVTYRPGLEASRVIVHLEKVEFGRGATLRDAVADAIQIEEAKGKR
jgi:hypothetical protein